MQKYACIFNIYDVQFVFFLDLFLKTHSSNFLKITFNITICGVALMISGYNFLFQICSDFAYVQRDDLTNFAT